jgi:preprotein translocase subunit SecG
MYPFFVALHVLLCLFLISVILLQPGKGGDVGAAFGGGNAGSLFGPRGPSGILQQATTIVAVLFMATSVTLALYSNRSMRANANVEEELLRLQQQQQQQQQQVAPPSEPAPAPEGPGAGAP